MGACVAKTTAEQSTQTGEVDATQRRQSRSCSPVLTNVASVDVGSPLTSEPSSNNNTTTTEVKPFDAQETSSLNGSALSSPLANRRGSISPNAPPPAPRGRTNSASGTLAPKFHTVVCRRRWSAQDNADVEHWTVAKRNSLQLSSPPMLPLHGSVSSANTTLEELGATRSQTTSLHATTRNAVSPVLSPTAVNSVAFVPSSDWSSPFTAGGAEQGDGNLSDAASPASGKLSPISRRRSSAASPDGPPLPGEVQDDPIRPALTMEYRKSDPQQIPDAVVESGLGASLSSAPMHASMSSSESILNSTLLEGDEIITATSEITGASRATNKKNDAQDSDALDRSESLSTDLLPPEDSEFMNPAVESA